MYELEVEGGFLCAFMGETGGKRRLQNGKGIFLASCLKVASLLQETISSFSAVLMPYRSEQGVAISLPPPLFTPPRNNYCSRINIPSISRFQLSLSLSRWWVGQVKIQNLHCRSSTISQIIRRFRSFLGRVSS